jgi:poly-gamma-glutamate synthesis protein (capsule biosynthesis protein)
MKLLFVGDIMLGRLVNQALKEQPPAYPWGDTLPIFEEADCCFANLECVLADIGRPWAVTPKVFHFRSDAKNVATLKAAEINAVSLANNHSLDFEYEALFEMLKLLKKAKIAHAGAGADLEAAATPAILKVGREKIGFLAFTDNEPAWEAGLKIPGVFYVPTDTSDLRAKNLFRIVQETKEKVDFLIVSSHWGPNWGYAPPAEQPAFAHALIDNGADLIFGHSSHVFRGIEVYRDKPILYSTGNFIDDYAVDEIERNDESFIFLVTIEKKQVSQIDLYPTLIENFQARLATGNEAENIALKMQTLCAEWQTPAEWQEKEKSLRISIA